MGLWKSIKNAAKSVGKFVKKNWKAIVGVAAAVAVPFVAPMIGSALAGSAFLQSVAPSVATFLGTAGGKALIGAGLGAVASGATGGNPLLGAALGGVGAYGVAGGFNGMFGGIGGGATGAPAAATPALGASGAVTGGQGIVALGGSAASGGIGSTIAGSIGSLATKLATNPQAIGALGQLAMTMFNKDVGELTKEEKAQLQEVAAQAGTDRALFEQRVMEARKTINMGTPNPEQAYANARFAVENQMADARRGLTPGLQEVAERKAAIAGAQSGALGVAADYGTAAQTRQAGLSMMPQQAPTGYNQLAMDTYASVEARRQKLAEQQSKAVGNLFGALA